ncbi:MAG: hypothetical protein J5635_04945 [Paludibacteraceae bacterium]|nr:hypothetical protein [Paludibacteraceae bacterium]
MEINLNELKGKHIVLDIHVKAVEDDHADGPDSVDEFEAYELDELPEDTDLETRESESIRRALVRNHGSRKRAAEDLQISERTLYRKIEKYGIMKEVKQ